MYCKRYIDILLGVQDRWGLRMSDFEGLDELLNRGAFHKSRGMAFRLKRIIASVAL